MPLTFIVFGLIAVVAVYLIIIYNHLVSLRENIKKNWSNIEVLLKQRHEELPKLVDTCRQYMQYEQETFEKIMRARTAVNQAQAGGDIGALGAAETDLRAGLGRLFAVAENYPELKANESFQHLQARITGLEESIADRREYYNESVNNNNIRIDQFPDLIVARWFGFPAADLLVFSEEQTANVDIGQLFENGAKTT